MGNRVTGGIEWVASSDVTGQLSLGGVQSGSKSNRRSFPLLKRGSRGSIFLLSSRKRLARRFLVIGGCARTPRIFTAQPSVPVSCSLLLSRPQHLTPHQSSSHAHSVTVTSLLLLRTSSLRSCERGLPSPESGRFITCKRTPRDRILTSLLKCREREARLLTRAAASGRTTASDCARGGTKENRGLFGAQGRERLGALIVHAKREALDKSVYYPSKR